MTSEEIAGVFGMLAAVGWKQENNLITAPHGTIWFSNDVVVSFGTVREFRDRMGGRLERILRILCEYPPGEVESLQQSLGDTASLVRCLERAVNSGEQNREM
jgi:hypothetical protein